ncbi:reverse transcriptase domain-containing protein [Tanacetum coccineum]
MTSFQKFKGSFECFESPSYNEVRCSRNAVMRVSTNAPPSSSTSSSSNFEFQQMAAALEDKMTLTFRNEMKKLPEKLGDPGYFLIPCDFTKMSKCMALADLGASINLMPLGIYQKIKLPELVTTKMTLKLANGSLAIPTGIAEDVLVKVGHFSFLKDRTGLN